MNTHMKCAATAFMLFAPCISPTSAPAQDPGNAALAAGIATGVVVGTGIGAQALTYSSLEVEVEMFIPNEKQKHLFHLDRPASISREAQESSAKSDAILSEGALRAFHLDAAKHIARIERESEGLARTVEWLLRADQVAGQPTYTAFNGRLSVAAETATLLARFRTEFNIATADGSLDQAERVDLAKIARRAVDSAAAYHDSYDASFVEFFHRELWNAAQWGMSDVLAEAENAGRQPKDMQVSFDWRGMKGRIDAVNGYEGFDKAFDDSPRNRIVASLDLAVTAWRSVKVAADAGTIKPSNAEDILARDLDAALLAMGFDTTMKQLANNDGTTISQKLARISPVESTGDALADIRLSYPALSASFNLGPVTNEAIQQLFSKGDIVGASLKNDHWWGRLWNYENWERVNHAKSRAGTGNHNSIIYMENMLTPVLKSSSFDPSEFIAANGIAFQRAFDVAAELYGVPLAPGRGSGSAGVAPLGPYNAQQGLAAQADADARREILVDGQLGAMKSIVDAGMSVPNTADANAAAAANVRAAIKAAAAKIRKSGGVAAPAAEPAPTDDDGSDGDDADGDEGDDTDNAGDDDSADGDDQPADGNGDDPANGNTDDGGSNGDTGEQPDAGQPSGPEARR